MPWQIQVIYPNQRTTTFPLAIPEERAWTIGYEGDIRLDDPSLPARWATLTHNAESPLHFQLTVESDAPSIRIGDLGVRSAEVGDQTRMHAGPLQVLLKKVQREHPLPAFPSGKSPWLTCSGEGRKLLWNSRKAADTSLSIYLGGETGTGKDVIAQLIHGWSSRASGSFVAVNCASFSLSLAESELFGHIKGSFTGAFRSRPGALLQAHNGTLFLDEVADLPMEIQVKLLRFLETGEMRPVGSDHNLYVDARVICATHKPLYKLVESGHFRRDLYYRLASVSLEIPPLRERPEDIALLASYFAEKSNRVIGLRAIRRLQTCSWPGNVRELRHCIERAVGYAGPFRDTLDEQCFEFLFERISERDNIDLHLGEGRLTLREAERMMVIRALRLTKGHRAQAAQMLGISRSTLFDLLKRYKIPGPPRGARFEFDTRMFATRIS